MIDDLIRRIADGDLSAFERLYNKYRGPFVRYFKAREQLSDSRAQDLYQDSCITIFNKIRTGNLTKWDSDDSKFNTYIIQIGRFLLLNIRRKRQIPLLFDTDKIKGIMDGDSNNDSLIDVEYDEELEVMVGLMRTSVAQMVHPCKEILTLTCFEKKSHQEVALIMNYASAETVGTQRSRCMKKLKAFVLEQFKALGYNYE